MAELPPDVPIRGVQQLATFMFQADILTWDQVERLEDVVREEGIRLREQAAMEEERRRQEHTAHLARWAALPWWRRVRTRRPRV